MKKSILSGFCILSTTLFHTSCVSTTEVFRDEVRITTEKLPCSDDCPEYRLSVYGDGWANYTGYDNVELIGDFEKFIGKEIADSLIVLFDETAFFTLPEDLPSPNFLAKQDVALSLKMGDYYNKVYYGDKGPAVFRKIDLLLGQIAEDEDGWQRLESDS